MGGKYPSATLLTAPLPLTANAVPAVPPLLFTVPTTVAIPLTYTLGNITLPALSNVDVYAPAMIYVLAPVPMIVLAVILYKLADKLPDTVKLPTVTLPAR